MLKDHRLRLTKAEHDLIKFNRSKEEEIILICSDLHIPYHHEDSINFLKAIKEHYNIKDNNPNHHIWNIGDEADFHGISMHDSETSLDTQHNETIKARKVFK